VTPLTPTSVNQKTNFQKSTQNNTRWLVLVKMMQCIFYTLKYKFLCVVYMNAGFQKIKHGKEWEHVESAVKLHTKAYVIRA
jgi:hypothetical protein